MLDTGLGAGDKGVRMPLLTHGDGRRRKARRGWAGANDTGKAGSALSKPLPSVIQLKEELRLIHWGGHSRWRELPAGKSPVEEGR